MSTATKRAPEKEVQDNITELTNKLNNLDPDVRLLAVDALGNIGDVRIIEPLLKALKDGYSIVRLRAANTLGEIGKSAVKQLIDALKDEEGIVRWRAAHALERICTEKAIKPLIRKQAVDALTKVRENPNEDSEVCLAAEVALETIEATVPSE